MPHSNRSSALPATARSASATVLGKRSAGSDLIQEVNWARNSLSRPARGVTSCSYAKAPM